MRVFLARTDDEPDPAGTPPDGLRWIRPDELEAYPFPRANIKAFPAILAALTSGNEECQ